MSRRPSNQTGLESESGALILHARLHCEDAAWVQSLERSIEFFPQSLRQTVQQYRRLRDRCARVLDKWILLDALRFMGASVSGLGRFGYDKLGRPFINELPGLDFSLAHSGEIVMCAVVKAGWVGVDVEQRRRVRIEDFRTFFPDSSWRRVAGSSQSQIEFFREWTRVEAILKAEGVGLLGSVNSISSAGAGAASFEGREWFLHELQIDPDYASTVALSFPHAQIEVRQVDWSISSGLQQDGGPPVTPAHGMEINDDRKIRQ